MDRNAKATLLLGFILVAVLLAITVIVVFVGPEAMVRRLTQGGIPAWLVTILIATLPILELRGALPIANQVFNIPILPSLGLSLLGNLIPVVPILLFLGPVSEWLQQFPVFDRFFPWLFARTRAKSELVQKYETIGLMLFVAVPLPMTGAWTGCIAAFLFGIPFWPALIAISLGVFIAGIIVTTLVLMGIWGAIIAGVALSALAVSGLWTAWQGR